VQSASVTINDIEAHSYAGLVFSQDTSSIGGEPIEVTFAGATATSKPLTDLDNNVVSTDMSIWGTLNAGSVVSGVFTGMTGPYNGTLGPVKAAAGKSNGKVFLFLVTQQPNTGGVPDAGNPNAAAIAVLVSQ
jgi:hypothetical protein